MRSMELGSAQFANSVKKFTSQISNCYGVLVSQIDISGRNWRSTKIFVSFAQCCITRFFVKTFAQAWGAHFLVFFLLGYRHEYQVFRSIERQWRRPSCPRKYLIFFEVRKLTTPCLPQERPYFLFLLCLSYISKVRFSSAEAQTIFVHSRDRQIIGIAFDETFSNFLHASVAFRIRNRKYFYEFW